MGGSELILKCDEGVFGLQKGPRGLFIVRITDNSVTMQFLLPGKGSSLQLIILLGNAKEVLNIRNLYLELFQGVGGLTDLLLEAFFLELVVCRVDAEKEGLRGYIEASPTKLGLENYFTLNLGGQLKFSIGDDHSIGLDVHRAHLRANFHQIHHRDGRDPGDIGLPRPH
jgi:hypothetical protein